MDAAGNVSIFVAMLAGLLSFLSPCTLPLFPSYLSFIAGVSYDELTGPAASSRTRRAVIGNSLFFIAGFTLAFVALGLPFSYLGQALARYQRTIAVVGGAFIIVMGLYVAGWLRMPFLMRYWKVELKARPAGYLGTLAAGVTFAVGWTPCVGPILGAILTMASTVAKASTGLKLLLAFSLGLGIPFFLSALALGRFLAVFDRYKRFLPVVSTVSGLLMIAVGALLVTDYFTILSRMALQLTPAWLFKYL
jgi:cytochrome c-type biogenesis protein